MDNKGPEKKEQLLAALDKGVVMIHLDARRPGVIVPPHLRDEFHLRLNLSYKFDPPDLTVGEWGVRSTLSFSGSRFTVAVPWSAIFAITSHAKEVRPFPDDMPPELLQQTMVTTKVPVQEVTPLPPRPRAVLREVEREEAPSESAPPPEPPKDEPPKPRGGHLRLVK
jgi:stringent starvation protein B